MTSGEEVYRAIQSKARSAAARSGQPPPTGEYLTRHALESFLFRLTRTEHADSFVLKGGILLAAYGVRRPTKDVDAQAISTTVTAQHLTQVVHDIAAIATGDGVTFDLTSVAVQEIRDGAEYPGLRLRVGVQIDSWKGAVRWDISTGDPIAPRPQTVLLPRVLGDDIEIIGYRPETMIAEKGVTILERGTTSTRWRDYIDIVQLPARHTINQAQLRQAAEAVARHRNINLAPIGPVIENYGAIAQAKWAAWRRKENVEDISEENLDDQLALVAAVLDPVFTNTTPGH